MKHRCVQYEMLGWYIQLLHGYIWMFGQWLAWILSIDAWEWYYGCLNAMGGILQAIFLRGNRGQRFHRALNQMSKQSWWSLRWNMIDPGNFIGWSRSLICGLCIHGVCKQKTQSSHTFGAAATITRINNLAGQMKWEHFIVGPCDFLCGTLQ